MRVYSIVLFTTILAVGGGLAAWKHSDDRRAAAIAASQPEPAEVVTDAVARAAEHRPTASSIGTVLAIRSIRLRNELPGTVRDVRLAPGRVVEAGEVLVALDVSVEEAELHALEAREALARTTFGRLERMAERRAIAEIELDNAQAELDVARAEVERTKAIIERKIIRAPFRARVGIADVHPGQFLDAGTLLTTLQGVDDAVDVEFTVAQTVALGLNPGDTVEVRSQGEGITQIAARIIATDARVDPETRNATVRARIDDAGGALTPGASVRVLVPSGVPQSATAVPLSALRRGPGGDHVFVLEATEEGAIRAHTRRVLAGDVVGDEVLVLDGLNPGERVAASGAFKLREAALVYVADDAAPASDEGR